MDRVDYHSLVGEALNGPLIDGLSPFVRTVLEPALPPGIEWPELLRAKDAVAGRRSGEYRSRDLSLMLRAMTERLGELGFPFTRQLPRHAENYARELRGVRNQWAHNEEFTAEQAYRAIDSAELLLRAIGAEDFAADVAKLKAAVSPVASIPAIGISVPPAQLEKPQGGQDVRPKLPSTSTAPRIDIAAVADLSYAMAHCRIPVIDHITLNNTGDDLRGAVVEVDVVSAEGSHGGPREVHVDLAAHAPTVLRSVDLKLDPASMLKVDEQRPGDIRVVLRNSTGEVISEATKDVNILAANQWKASPPQLALEMLAAYVQPNSAAISALMTEVSDRLRASTGNSAIDGYQSENPERVDAIARAVFDAMRGRDIRYAEPPASWGDDGQKVRTPAEVLEGRLGTCLDTTLTMAAVLEQAGINSTIWVLSGHALLGYWRNDQAMGVVSTTEVIDVVNQVDLHNIALVETTMATQSAVDATFADAVAAPRSKHLSGDLSGIIGITDVRQAREARIFPLPSRSVDGDGNTVVAEYKPGDGRVILQYVASAGETRTPDREAVPSRIAQWKNALLDLSLRNKLINYTDRAGYTIEVPGPALGRFEDDINAGAQITLLPSDELDNIEKERGVRFGRELPEQRREQLLADKRSAYIDITDAAYKSKLRFLANKAKTIVQETGANNLYLAFGMLNWRFNDRDLRSPLVLVPVTLSTKNRGERYLLTIDEAGASTPNYCLLEKLRTAFGLNISEFANPAEDASGIDLDGTFNAVRRAIADARLSFRVEETVQLSILQFAKFPLWKDLDESWKDLSHNSLVKHLIETPQERFVDPVAHAPDLKLDELSTSVPVPADSSQLQAIADAVGGLTFVLEGPPGTGKSQTITNLLAHAISSGRRVLFVAEKRAALDVVKKRLELVGLGELSLDLHDKSARPAAVREQIRAALDLRTSHDADLLRTQLQTAESSRLSLDRYAQRLHATNAADQSLYTARSSELAADQDVEPLEVPRELVAGAPPETFTLLRNVFRSLPEKADLAQPRTNHPWGFIDVPPPNGLDASTIHAAAVELDSGLATLQASGIALEKLANLEDPSEVKAWALLTTEPRFPLDGIDALSGEAGKVQLAAIERLLTTITGTKHEWLSSFTPAALDLDVPAIHQAAAAADESGFFGRKKRRRAVLAQLSDVLAIDAANVPLKMLSELTGQISETYALATDLRTKVAGLPVRLFDREWNPLLVEDVTQLTDGIAALRRIGQMLSTNSHRAYIRDLREFFGTTARDEMRQPLNQLASGWTRLGELTGASTAQQSMWAGERSFLEQWWATRSARRIETSASIERWVDLINHVEPLRTVGMTAARAELLKGAIIPEDAALAFDRGIAAASVGERLEASALTDFDVNAHSKTIDRFTKSAKLIRDELRRAIPAQLVGGRTFNVDSSTGQVGGLRRQLTVKRGGMSVRALMDNYGDLITQVLPCTLMSPDSVARFFPARPDIFDIVVFDEASQIRVADAVGAMGRAKSVVVVGDSKQMPPTSFAETSATLDDDEDYKPDVVVDEESILTECVTAQVPQQWLSWHYRSQDEALIAFSNINYYNGHLASFPAPLTGDSGHGVSLVRVDGQFERSGSGKTLRTNAAEAERIVADIRRRFDESPDRAPSLGVITFNAQQRNFIENMLRDAGDDRLLHALDEPDGLFVKNLENVQGDERDTILFSVAFSKNARGVVPLNFGPLSRPGGERRLNVAITRARCEVVLYASFDPGELRAEETTQIGTKHLKAYLEMAARGVETITTDGKRQPVIDRHRDDIATALRSEGLIVSTDVGLSDFRVDLVIADPDEPDRPLVAVLLDGQEWFGRRTVADRDGLPIDVLGNLMHWPGVQRVWMPEWLKHRAETIARLKTAVVDAKELIRKRESEPECAEPQPVQTPEPPVETPEPVGAEPMRFAALRSAAAFASGEVNPPAPRLHPMIQQFKPWSPQIHGNVGVLDDLWNTASSAMVRSVAREVIEVEGPIERGRLARLVAGAFGLGRVNEDRRRSIQQLVPGDFTRPGDRDFYWPNGIDPESWRTVRRPADAASRPLDEISLVEIGNAMLVVAEESGGIDAAGIKREALALFGGKRVTQAIGTRLDAALTRALDKGLLTQAGSGVLVATPAQ